MLDAFLRPADTPPVVWPDFASSLAIPAALIGANLQYRDESTWVHQMPDVYDRDLPEFSPSHPVFASLNESLKVLGQNLADQALLTAPYYLDSLTTLSLLRGAEQLCFDLIERPDDVLRVVEHMDRVYLAAYDAWWKTLTAFQAGHTVTWADVCMPGRCEMIQCDFCVNISPEMFDRFAMPSLQRTCAAFDRVCYHLDGAEQYRFIERFCSIPNLQSIQWQPGDMNRQPMKYLEYFKDMRKRNRAVWIMAFDTQSVIDVTRTMGPDGIMFYLRDVESMDELDRMMDELVNVCRKG